MEEKINLKKWREEEKNYGKKGKYERPLFPRTLHNIYETAKKRGWVTKQHT